MPVDNLLTRPGVLQPAWTKPKADILAWLSGKLNATKIVPD